MMRSVIAVLVVVSLAPTAFGDITSLSPSSFTLGSAEETITITGTGLAGTRSTRVDFSGPAGTFFVLPDLPSSTSITVSVPFPILLTSGRYSIVVTATDTSGTVRQSGPAFFDVVTLVGNLPPLIGLPEVVYGEADSPTGANVTFTVNAISQASLPLTVSCNHQSGDRYPLGTTSVSCTATDANGSAGGSFLIVVGDTVRPDLTVPADIVSATAIVTFTATAVDAIDGNVTPTCSPASGSTFPAGTTTVVCTATDSHANSAQGSFKVTVTAGAPALTVPDDMTVEATSPQGAVVTFEATSTPPGPVTCSPASGSTFPLGTTTVQCSATNVNGTTTASFKITVVDTTPPPIVMIRATPNVLAPPDHKLVLVKIDIVTADLVDPLPISRIVDVTSNEPVNGPGDGNTDPDWAITSPLTLLLRAERAGTTAADRIYTITIETTDHSGNSSIGTTEVRVPLQVRRRAAG
jgi:HYR domain-containing protein